MDSYEQPPSEHDEPMDEALRRQIAQRAYEISQSDQAGTDEENWLRAEQEVGTPTSPSD